VTASSRSGKDGALLFIDLDHFKTLNDTHGHVIGDILLQQVGERLSTCLRESDAIERLARFGGDEFVVTIEGLSENVIEASAQAEIIGQKIQHTLNQPYQLESHEYQSTVSIGVALFSDHIESYEDLLKHADIAMYQAKKAGRNVIRFFNPKMQEAIHHRVELERELRKALDKEQFKLHYQIQVDHLGNALGAEALIRWIHPERGLISPFHFIPLAEETGLILPIGNWVLDIACRQLKAWEMDPLTQNLTISVNVSAKQFNQTDFATQVQSAVQHYSINPALLKLELTESMLVDNLEHVIITMVALESIGIQFSLDDFGTGYSSLQYLKMLPMNQLKIDQSFVRDIVIDSNDRSIVRTIITMAQSLSMEVIAEGVETAEQQELLMNKGCKKYQGYLFGKPMPIEQFEVALIDV
jgi:diguanylate cyclase (GGDEF)-like protein